MPRDYRLHELYDRQLEQLVGRICHDVLGTGTIVFAEGRDGGRDGRFEGTADKFPSVNSPASGRFVIQSKHTSNPAASCSDSDFDRIVAKEKRKVEALVEAKELDYYLLFTNRRLTAGRDKTFRDELKTIKGLKDAWLIGVEKIHDYIALNDGIWTSMGFDQFATPLRIVPEDIGAVIHAFYEQRQGLETTFASATNFTYARIAKKNEINNLSSEYYAYIQTDSMPYFGEIAAFLKNPRNRIHREQYHSTADELKAKLIARKSEFNTFDEALTNIYDLVVGGNKGLGHRRKLAHVFLHYMYCDCDIGEHA